MTLDIRYVLLFILMVPLLPSGCELTDGGDCMCDEVPVYAVTDLGELYVAGTDPSVVQEDTTVVAALSLQMTFDLVAVARRTAASQHTWWTQAMACSCVGPFVETTLVELSITSTGQVNEDFPPGSELSSWFVSDIGFFNDGSYGIDLRFPENASGDDLPEGALTLRLPETEMWEEEVHELTVKMTLSDGQSFDNTLSPVLLQAQ